MQNQYSSKRIAIVGCGYWGKNLVRNFAQLGSLALVCDPSPDARQTAMSVAPRTRYTENFDDVLDSDVDGVVIATPAKTHFALAQKSLEAGKDVFVEKPLCLDLDQGQSLVKFAEEQECILMVGHVLEYHPAVSKLIQIIKSGKLGRILYIYSNRLSLGKVRQEENILWSFAPHDIAIILRIMDALPLQVAASGGAYLQANVADVTVTNLLFSKGVRAHIHVSWLHPFKEQRLVVIGSKAMASFDDVGKRLIVYTQPFGFGRPMTEPITTSGDDIAYCVDAEPLRIECQAFLEAIITRQPALTDGASGVRVLEVLQAAQRSLLMNGEPVKVPLEVS